MVPWIKIKYFKIIRGFFYFVASDNIFEKRVSPIGVELNER